MRKGDRIAGIIIVLLGIAVLIYSNSLNNPNAGYIDASFFPNVIGILFIVTGSMLVIDTIRKSKYTGEEKITLYFKEAVMIVAYFVYIILMPYVGYMIMTPLLIAGLTFYLGYRKIYANLIIGVVVMISVYVLFNKLLSVPLPTGIFF